MARFNVWVPLLSVTSVLAACGESPSSPSQPSPSEATSASFGVAGTGAEVEYVPEQYIVVFREGARDVPGLARRLAAQHGSSPRYTYTRAIKGFAARLPAQAAAALARNPNVAYVEQDQVIRVSETQTSATWGLDRIDQRALPLSTTFSYVNTGAGVTAYIIDTGIRLDHPEFATEAGSRATSGFDAVDGGTADDCDGHGTHVAGTVGGKTYGVAKGVSLVAVRVLNCSGSGTTSGVIAGIDWVTADHDPGEVAVANMSLGGGISASLDAAVQKSIADGVSYAIAAGNGNRGGQPRDACDYSPARVPEAMTIAATDWTDAAASFSNYGSCVDWFAPGVWIKSAWPDATFSADMTRTLTGTSMAAPHVAGAAALYLQSNPAATPPQVRDALYESATKNVVKTGRKAPTANNHLLFTNY